ncbi:MAG: XTP/dITP diphosphatase [Candidatus Bathyarchaeia archaeon]
MMDSQTVGRVVFFATNNLNKFREACMVMREFNLAMGMLRVKALEIQSEDLEEIAKSSVLDAFEKCCIPIIVEDAGLFIEALNGFPGPYASYVYRTIGNEGLLKLMENVKLRKATFQSVVAYFSAELAAPICFKGEVVGEITEEVRAGCSGFGFDPIFKPERSDKTFAEMDIKEKNMYSHRAKALREFAKWYIAHKRIV